MSSCHVRPHSLLQPTIWYSNIKEINTHNWQKLRLNSHNCLFISIQLTKLSHIQIMNGGRVPVGFIHIHCYHGCSNCGYSAVTRRRFFAGGSSFCRGVKYVGGEHVLRKKCPASLNLFWWQDTEESKSNIPCYALLARQVPATFASDSRMWRAHPVWIRRDAAHMSRKCTQYSRTMCVM
jgi:hypothetical protein